MKDEARNRKAALAEHLKRAVLTLDLPPGTDLDETALAEAFGLSRTPLREVCRELCGAGYLELHAGRGARVSEMSHTGLRDFFLAAPMIYGAIHRLAAQNATPAQLAALKDAQAAFRAALRDGSTAERTLANNRFHEITGEMAGNIYLLPSFRRLLIDHARISMTFYGRRDGDDDARAVAADQHDAIIAAIAAGDAEAAAALAEAHWALSRDRIEAFVMPAPIDAALGSAPGAPNARTE